MSLNFRLSTRITAAALIFVVVAGILVMFAEDARVRNEYISEQHSDLARSLDAEKLQLNYAIKDLQGDVLFLSNIPPVSGLIRATLNHGLDARDGDTLEKWEARMQQIFTAFSSAHPAYYQIRFIGVADGGREIVRVVNRGGKVEISPSSQLQAKADRDYFKATLKEDIGHVSLSEFDPREELDDIVRPYLPTLRASTPVYSPSGKIFGMVVINMDTRGLLESSRIGLPKYVQTYVTNMEGQYLLHPDTQKLFGINPESKNNIKTDFPFLQKTFDQKSSGGLAHQVISTKVGEAVVASERIFFDPHNPSRFLFLMHYIPDIVEARQVATIPAMTVAGGFIVMLLIGGIALLILRRTFSPLEQITKAADKIAAGDRDIALPQGGSGEISSLTNALNTMLSNLSQREQEIIQNNAELEDRVRDRTEQLIEANEAMAATNEELSATNEELAATSQELSVGNEELRAIQEELTVANEQMQHDAVERERLGEELKKALVAADAASLAKGDFIANMSHEIRTPMNAIIGLSNLCMQTELMPKQKDYLQKVHGSAKSLLGILNEVLDFSKIEAGKIEIEHVPFDLRDVMSNLTMVVSTKAEEKGIELLFETSLNVYPHLVGDPLRLGQVLINLVGNAVKFTERGKVLVLTEVEEESGDGIVLRFTIRDSGIGMTQEQIGKLFKAFTQADSSTTRKFGGTGLGLSISKKIVALMNGKIWVESTPNKGAEFIFTARFGKTVAQLTDERPRPSTALFRPDLVAKISGAYLLLVEDNEINQQVARELLEKAGITVAVAENGEEAIARLWQEKFDGVLMDMQMPVMDGLTSTREIRKNPRLADLPIIAMTANVMTGDRERCVAAGMNDHIAKPLDPNEMITTLAKWIVPAQPAALQAAPDLKAMQDKQTLPDLPGVLVNDGVSRMGGSVDGYCVILEKFRSRQQNTLIEIRSAIAANDWGKAKRLAHTLKGLLGTLGADKLSAQAAKLEAVILSKANVQIELLLSTVDLELNQLFAAIDQALQLRGATKLANGELADTAGPINMEELTILIRQLKSQLEQFDSAVEDTVDRIRLMVCDDTAMKKTMVSIKRHVSGYDYEKGLAELNACAKSMGILSKE